MVNKKVYNTVQKLSLKGLTMFWKCLKMSTISKIKMSEMSKMCLTLNGRASEDSSASRGHWRGPGSWTSWPPESVKAFSILFSPKFELFLTEIRTYLIKWCTNLNVSSPLKLYESVKAFVDLILSEIRTYSIKSCPNLIKLCPNSIK